MVNAACCWERYPVIVNFWPVGNGRSRKLSCKFTTKLVDTIFGVSYINTWSFSVIPVVTASKLRRRQRLRWSSGSVLAFGTQVRPKNPTHFRAKKSSARLPSEGK